MSIWKLPKMSLNQLQNRNVSIGYRCPHISSFVIKIKNFWTDRQMDMGKSKCPLPHRVGIKITIQDSRHLYQIQDDKLTHKNFN